MKFQRMVTANARQCLSRVHKTSAVYGIIHWEGLGVCVSYIISIRQLWQKLQWNFHHHPMSLRKGGSTQEPCWRHQTVSSILLYAVAQHGDKVAKADRLRLHILLLGNCSSASANLEAWKGNSGKGSQVKSQEMLRFQHAGLPSRQYSRRMNPAMQEQKESNADCLRPFDLHLFLP